MTYRFLDDIAIADMAFEVEGGSLEELFAEAAKAFLAIHLENPDDLQSTETTAVEVSHRELDILLYQFLQELVFLKDTRGLLVKVQTIEIQKLPRGFEVKAQLEGEIADPTRHHLRSDVKAITFHRLELKKTATGFLATVIADV